MSDATIRRPTDRRCELCGRTETWNQEADAWQVVREDGQPLVGKRYCIHEWDINGSFVPVENAAGNADAEA